jgi:hypothetical protein
VAHYYCTNMYHVPHSTQEVAWHVLLWSDQMKAMPSECGPASLFKLSVAWDEILPSSHFTDEFMEAQRGEAPCPGMPSNEAAGIGFEPILKELSSGDCVLGCTEEEGVGKAMPPFRKFIVWTTPWAKSLPKARPTSSSNGDSSNTRH